MGRPARERFDPLYVANVTPQIYVGLGGVGTSIVLRLRHRLLLNERWRRYREPCTGFLALDTNYHDLAAARESKITGVHLAQRGRAAQLRSLRAHGDPWLETWLPKDYEPREEVPGAGQIRIESRVGFYVFADEIVNRIEHVMGRMLDPSNRFLRQAPKNLEIYMFGSLAGGTCSGSFLSAALLFREEVRARGWTPRIFGHFLTATPLVSTVGPALADLIHANSYAALKELEALNRGTYEGQPRVRFAHRRPDEKLEPIPEVKEPPFDWTVIIDEPAGLELGRKTAAAVADIAYLNLNTPAQSAQEGERDNYTRFMRRVSRPMGDDGTRSATGFTKNYGTFGAAALVCPEETLLDYCMLRFQAWAFRTQLSTRVQAATGSRFNPNDPKWAGLPAEQLARVLAKQWCGDVMESARQEEQSSVDRLEEFKRLTGEGLNITNFVLGSWAKLYRDVEGRPAFEHTDAGTTPAADAGVGKGKAPGRGRGAAGSGQVGYREWVRKHFTDKLSKVPRLEAAPPPEHEVADRFGDELQRLKTRYLEAEESRKLLTAQWVAAARAGECFKELRRRQPGFDAMQERYLVIRLLLEDITPWIEEAKNTVRAKTAASLAAPDEQGTRAAEWRRIQEEMRGADSVKQRVLLKRSAARLAAKNKAHEVFSGARDATNDLLRARANLEQLEALHEYLKRRAGSFAVLSRAAEGRADRLEEEAAELLSRGGLAVDDYFLRMEALRPLDATEPRQWDLAWQDIFLPEVRPALDNGQWLGALVSDAIAMEESRASAANATFQPHFVIQHVQQQLGHRAEQLLGPAIQGDPEAKDPGQRAGFTLLRALVLEAKYCTMSDSDRADPTRRLKLLGGEEIPDSAIATYVEKKLASLLNQAQPLARLDHGRVTKEDGGRALATGILIGDESMLEALEKRFPEALSVLTSAGGEVDDLPLKPETGRGLQEWDDPRQLIAFKGYGAIPMYAFRSVSEAHAEYTRVMALGNEKPNPLHTDFTWEHTLPDLDDVATRRREDAQLALLARLARAGIAAPMASTPAWTLVMPDGRASTLCESPEQVLLAFDRLLRLNPGLEDLLTKNLKPGTAKATAAAVAALRKFEADEVSSGRGDSPGLSVVKRFTEQLSGVNKP